MARSWFVSDLDGTLLSPEAVLSTASRALLTRALTAGVPFTVASARSVVSIRHLLGDLPVRLPVVAHNGAMVADLRTGEAFHLEVLEPAVAERVRAVIARHGLEAIVCAHDGVEEHIAFAPPQNPAQAAYLDDLVRAGDPRLRRVPGATVHGFGGVIGLTAIGAPAVIDPLLADLRALGGVHAHRFEDLYTPGWAWITVDPPGATKAAGIAHVARLAGLDARRLVVFGDAANDAPMFRAADHAVAVGNAAPEILALAHEVIGRNAEDAVARYVAAAV